MSDKIPTMYCHECKKRMPVAAHYMVPGPDADPVLKQKVPELEILFCVVCETVTNIENDEIVYEEQGWEGWTTEEETSDE